MQHEKVFPDLTVTTQRLGSAFSHYLIIFLSGESLRYLYMYLGF